MAQLIGCSRDDAKADVNRLFYVRKSRACIGRYATRQPATSFSVWLMHSTVSRRCYGKPVNLTESDRAGPRHSAGH
jgi:hypothetical protein